MPIERRAVGDGRVGEGEPVLPLGDLTAPIALPRLVGCGPLQGPTAHDRARRQSAQALVVVGDLPCGLEEHDTDIEQQGLRMSHGHILPMSGRYADPASPRSGTSRAAPPPLIDAKQAVSVDKWRNPGARHLRPKVLQRRDDIE